MFQIPLGDSIFALIDDCDIDLAVCHSWCLDRGTMNIVSKIRGKRVCLHKVIADRMGLNGDLVDHENQNKLDNQRSNLRNATKSENAINSKLRINNTSGFRGVQFEKRTGKWFARIKVQGKVKSLGTFEDFDKAVEARIMAERHYFGVFAQV